MEFQLLLLLMLLLLLILCSTVSSSALSQSNLSSGDLFPDFASKRSVSRSSMGYLEAGIDRSSCSSPPGDAAELGSGTEHHSNPPRICPVPCLPCDVKECLLPNCKCSDFSIPGNLRPVDTPQIVIVTLQNAVRNDTYQSYLRLFRDLRNPNGCPASGTYFVSHEYTDYFEVQSLRSAGHEIADNSVTSGNSSEYWKQATRSTWRQELGDQMKILRVFSNVTDVRGVRAPYLQPGGDSQLSAVQDLNLLYDSSRVSTTFSRRKTLLWPYTYDYKSRQDCISPPCPLSCYQGVWEIPLLSFWDGSGNPCALLDACSVQTYDDVFRLLWNRFSEHRDGNRAPLVISMSPDWLKNDFKFRGTRLFLEYLQGYKNVYMVSAGQALDWVQHPVRVSELSGFQPWKCDLPPLPVCRESEAIVCFYDKNRKKSSTVSVYALRACISQCPPCYPWLKDPWGLLC